MSRSGRKRSICQNVLVFLAFVFLPGVCFGQATVPDDVLRDAENLRALAVQVRAILPPGWRADFTFDFPLDPAYAWAPRSDKPCLVVYYENEARGHWLAPGMPAVGEGEDWPFEPLRVWMSLTLEEYVSPEAYQDARRKNQALKQRRLAFERRLASIPYGHKGSDPKPPSAYRPESPDQSELVRQYSLLWMRTEPTPLPTHHFRTVGLTVMFPIVRLEDSNLQQKLEQIEAGISRIVVSYED
jgi:hypothetical protein